MLRKASPMQTASNDPGTPAGFSHKRKPGHHRLQNQPTTTVSVPIGELVNKVIQLVEVVMSEFGPVKAVTAAEKMRATVASIFG
jgi:hypothetical protein